MSITTKDIQGPRPLSRAELIDLVHELKRSNIDQIMSRQNWEMRTHNAESKVKELEAYIRKTQPNYSYAEYK